MPRIRFTDIDNQPAELEVSSTDSQSIQAAIKQHIDGRLNKRKELQAGYEAERPTAADPSDLQNFRAGIGQGMVDTVRSVGNMVGLKSDEEVRESRRLDKDLLGTKAGMGGSIVGATAITAPAMAAATPARLAAARPILTAALQGAGAGAIAANPGERVQGAVLGGALGGGLSTVARGSRALATGLVRVKPAAQQLMNEGTWVPLHMAAEKSGVSGGLKTLYGEYLRVLPIAGQKLAGQADEAFNAFRTKAASDALPQGARGILQNITDPHQIAQRLQQFWGSKPMNAVVNRTGASFKWPELVQAVSVLPKKMQVAVGQYMTGNADDLVVLRSEIIPGLKIPDSLKAMLTQKIDDVATANFSRGSKPLIGKWKELVDAYPKYRVIQSAIADASKEHGGRFLPHTLSKVAAESVDEATAARGTAPMQRMAEQGYEALERGGKEPGWWQRMAVMGSLGGAGYAGGVPAVGGAIAAGTGAAAKPTQRVLMGQYGAQKKLAEVLRRRAAEMRRLGLIGRTAAVEGSQ